QSSGFGGEGLSIAFEGLDFTFESCAVCCQRNFRNASRVLYGQRPPLSRQASHCFGGLWNGKTVMMSVQPAAKPLPPSLQPPSDGVRRAGTQMRTDAFDSWSLAATNDLVSGRVNVGFGDASGHGIASYANALLCSFRTNDK